MQKMTSSISTADATTIANMGDEQIADAFTKDVRGDVLGERSPKYRAFMHGMDAVVQLSPLFYEHGRERGQFLRIYYMVMRRIDDIVDGDAPLPHGYTSPIAVLEDIIAWNASQENTATDQQNVIKRLLRYCFVLGKKFGQDFTEETSRILSSLLFDAKRKGSKAFHPEDALQTYFHDRDISGTIRGCLKICDEDVEHERSLAPLGNATRIFYNLRDFQQDTAAGFINISSEDANRLGVTIDEVKHGLDSKSVREWWQEQIATGLHLLHEHQTTFATSSLKGLTKRILYHGFERPAKRFFLEQWKALEGAIPEPSFSSILRSPVRYGLATAQATRLGLRHRKQLALSGEDEGMFMRKVRNLSLCYSDLSTSTNPMIALRAAKAGLLSAVYDVVTDRKAFDEKAFGTFTELLAHYCSPDEQELAVDLYRKDKEDILGNDGLERGAVALEFIVSVMNIRDEFARRGISILDAGEELQIVDDVLDYAADMETGDTNCLRASHGDRHLRKLLDSTIPQHFHPNSILRKTIEQARVRARFLLKICSEQTSHVREE